MTGDHVNHARGVVEAERILKKIGCFTPKEIELVRDAIHRHADEDAIDGDVAERLKDADVLQYHLCNPDAPSACPKRLTPSSPSLSCRQSDG